MITKVVHGWRPGGLIAYLMGPGRAEEHRRPRVIASWDGRDAEWQPVRSGPGEWDLELGPLIRALRAPAVAAGLPEHGDEHGRLGYVWHCSARLAGADRVLGDGEWASIARELLAGAGVASVSDPGGPRWVAIRHADDHVHIAVVLVRQDSCRRFWPYRDYPRLREAAREIEQRLGLTITAAADGTAAAAPARGELEKAKRLGREPARIELARAVREAAVAGVDAESFVGALRERGYLAQLRYGPSGDPLGYKVARHGDVTSEGDPVFYSGSKLAPDLSMPRLLERWRGVVGGESQGDPVRAARLRVQRARRAVAGARRGDNGADAEEIVHAAADVFTAVRGWPGTGEELGRAADLFDRAARSPVGAARRSSAASIGLRRTARQLLRQRRLVEDGDLSAVVALVVAVAALVREIGRWHSGRQCVHQAAAAEACADVVDRWSAAWSRVNHVGDQGRSYGPATDHASDHVVVDAQPQIRPPVPRLFRRPSG